MKARAVCSSVRAAACPARGSGMKPHRRHGSIGTGKGSGVSPGRTCCLVCARSPNATVMTSRRTAILPKPELKPKEPRRNAQISAQNCQVIIVEVLCPRGRLGVWTAEIRCRKESIGLFDARYSIPIPGRINLADSPHAFNPNCLRSLLIRVAKLPHSTLPRYSYLALCPWSPILKSWSGNTQLDT